MSVLFPKLNKPRQWDYRPIYYDKEKDEHRQRLQQLQDERKRAQNTDENQTEGTYKPRLHRGSFREEAEKKGSVRIRENRKTKIRFFVALLLILLFFLYFLM